MKDDPPPKRNSWVPSKSEQVEAESIFVDLSAVLGFGLCLIKVWKPWMCGGAFVFMAISQTIRERGWPPDRFAEDTPGALQQSRIAVGCLEGSILWWGPRNVFARWDLFTPNNCGTYFVMAGNCNITWTACTI
jgi:hypothetical protein